MYCRRRYCHRRFAFRFRLSVRFIEAIILSFPAKPRLYNSLAFLQAPISLFFTASVVVEIASDIRRQTAAVLP